MRVHDDQSPGFDPVTVVRTAAIAGERGPEKASRTTGGSFARRRGFAVSLEEAGTRTTGAIRCDQPRTFDLGARKGKRLESVPESIMDDVPARLATILE